MPHATDTAPRTGEHVDGYEVPVLDEHRTVPEPYCLYVMGTDLTDDDVECHEGRQIVFVDPARVDGLPLTRAAAGSLPLFLASDTYQELCR